MVKTIIPTHADALRNTYLTQRRRSASAASQVAAMGEGDEKWEGEKPPGSELARMVWQYKQLCLSYYHLTLWRAMKQIEAVMPHTPRGLRRDDLKREYQQLQEELQEERTGRAKEYARLDGRRRELRSRILGEVQQQQTRTQRAITFQLDRVPTSKKEAKKEDPKVREAREEKIEALREDLGKLADVPNLLERYRSHIIAGPLPPTEAGPSSPLQEHEEEEMGRSTERERRERMRERMGRRAWEMYYGGGV